MILISPSSTWERVVLSDWACCKHLVNTNKAGASNQWELHGTGMRSGRWIKEGPPGASRIVYRREVFIIGRGIVLSLKPACFPSVAVARALLAKRWPCVYARHPLTTGGSSRLLLASQSRPIVAIERDGGQSIGSTSDSPRPSWCEDATWCSGEEGSLRGRHAGEVLGGGRVWQPSR